LNHLVIKKLYNKSSFHIKLFLPSRIPHNTSSVIHNT